MTGSKQGHKRYTLTKELIKLNNELVFLCENDGSFKRERLEFRGRDRVQNVGYYLCSHDSSKQLPVRSIVAIRSDQIFVDNDYLKKRGASW